MLARGASAHDRQRTRRRSGESLPIRVCSPPGQSAADRQRTRRPGPGLVGRRFLENPVGNTREGRVGSSLSLLISGGPYPPLIKPPETRAKVAWDLPATVGFCATPPRAEIGPQKCSRISAPRSRGRTAWFSSRLTRRAAPLSRRPGCAPPPPTETCGRSPLAAPVVFLTGRSREQTRPRGRRSSWSPARCCGRARGGDRRRLGGQDCGRSKSVLR